jgi:imidazolonepropionase-like amidohydrolase
MANREAVVKRVRTLLLGAAALLAVVGLLRIGLALRPPHLLVVPPMPVLADLTLINPGRDRRPHQVVTIRDGHIESISDDDRQRRPPSQRIFAGRYALPGLIDLQVRRLPTAAHLRRLFGIYWLNAGVTTVRVLGSVAPPPPELRLALATDVSPWPRIFACGSMLTDSAPGCRLDAAVGTRSATTVVDALAASGADCAAIHRSLPANELLAVRDAAAARGLPVAGDLPAGATVTAGAPMAIDALTLIPPLPPGRTASDWLRAWAALPADAGAAVAHTLPVNTTVISAAARWNLLGALDDTALDQLPFVALLPRSERERRWRRELAAAGELTSAQRSQAVAALLGALAQLHAAGVPLALGSGTPSPGIAPGAGLWIELQTIAARLGPEAAWTAATRTAGAALGIPQLGVLEAGAPADMLLFRADPTQDLNALSTLEAVISQGRLFYGPRLNGDMLEVARYVQRPLYDRFWSASDGFGDAAAGAEDDCAPL